MSKFCFLGASLSQDKGNMGVSALAASLVKLALNTNPDAEICFFVGRRSTEPWELLVEGRKVKIDVLNYRLSPKAHPKEHLFWILMMAVLFKLLPSRFLKERLARATPALNALTQCHFIGDIRGGDSFSDIYGPIGFVLGSLPSIIVLLLGKKLVLLPQTYGPYKSPISKIIARSIFKRADWVLSRDSEGIDTVKQLLGKHASKKRIFLCPDVAFVLDPEIPARLDVMPEVDTRFDRPLVGFNINGLLYNGGFTRNNMFGLKLDYKKFVESLTDSVLRNTSAHLLLVPHTFAPKGDVESDPAACREIADLFIPKYADRVHIVLGGKDQSELKGIIGLCDFFIGSRMHACIAALSQGIPTVGVAYSQKFKGVFDSIGLGGMVMDARTIDQNEAIFRIMNLISEQGTDLVQLRAQIRNAQEKVKATFQEILIAQNPLPRSI